MDGILPIGELSLPATCLALTTTQTALLLPQLKSTEQNYPRWAETVWTRLGRPIASQFQIKIFLTKTCTKIYIIVFKSMFYYQEKY